jgi:hypothetical protein
LAPGAHARTMTFKRPYRNRTLPTPREVHAVALTSFDVLDRLMEGKPLPARDLFGSRKAADAPEAKALLEQLTTDGLVSVKGNKYSLAEGGRAAWRREAPPEKLAALDERERQEERRQTAELVAAVERSQGKRLKGKFPEALVARAVERGLIEAVRNNVYRVLPPGEALLSGGLPVEQQAASLRRMTAEVSRRWQAASERLREEIASLDEANTGLRETGERLAAEAAQANEALDAVAGQLGAYGMLLSAAQAHKARMEASYADVRQQLEAARTTVEALQGKLAEEGRRVREQVEATLREILERLTELEKRPVVAPADAAVETVPAGESVGVEAGA